MSAALVGMLPDGLDWTAFWLLGIASFLGSLMTAALGVGGGAFLLIVMAEFISPMALIPLHGVVQLGSNANRAWHTRANVLPRVVVPFALGALVAAASAVWFLGKMNLAWVPLLVALFILWLSWGPMPTLNLIENPGQTALGGWVTTLATMVFGATGPLVSAWLGRSFGDRLTYTACFSFCMTWQHFLKIGVFLWAGFNFMPWMGLVVWMIGLGYGGTLVGLRLLHHLPEAAFRKIFRWVLTLLALRVLWNAWPDIVG